MTNDDINQLDYDLRAATKRTDLPDDIIRLLSRAYGEIIANESTIYRLESQYGVQYDRAEKMKSERDEARMEVCTLSGNGSYNSTEREAESRGWEYLFAEENPTYVCDHCGEYVDSNNAFHYAELPRDIASANQGESATLCRKCEEMIEADANNEYFKKNHR
jgi:hypothetical protein